MCSNRRRKTRVVQKHFCKRLPDRRLRGQSVERAHYGRKALRDLVRTGPSRSLSFFFPVEWLQRRNFLQDAQHTVATSSAVMANAGMAAVQANPIALGSVNNERIARASLTSGRSKQWPEIKYRNAAFFKPPCYRRRLDHCLCKGPLGPCRHIPLSWARRISEPRSRRPHQSFVPAATNSGLHSCRPSKCINFNIRLRSGHTSPRKSNELVADLLMRAEVGCQILYLTSQENLPIRTEKC